MAPVFVAPLFVLALLCVVALAYAAARRATSAVAEGSLVVLDADAATAQTWVYGLFPVAQWEYVAGDGQVNLRRRYADGSGPSLSVYAEDRPEGGCDVHVWVSGCTLRGGLVRHAGTARRQQLLVAGEMMRTDAQHAIAVAAGEAYASTLATSSNTTLAALSRPAIDRLLVTLNQAAA